MEDENWNLDDNDLTNRRIPSIMKWENNLEVLQKALMRDAEFVTSAILSLNVQTVDCNARNCNSYSNCNQKTTTSVSCKLCGRS